MPDNNPPLETPESDRIYYAVQEALEGGMDPRELQDTVGDAIREWRQAEREREREKEARREKP